MMSVTSRARWWRGTSSGGSGLAAGQQDREHWVLPQSSWSYQGTKKATPLGRPCFAVGMRKHRLACAPRSKGMKIAASGDLGRDPPTEGHAGARPMRAHTARPHAEIGAEHVRRSGGEVDVGEGLHTGYSSEDPRQGNPGCHEMQANDTKNLHMCRGRASGGAAAAGDTL